MVHSMVEKIQLTTFQRFFRTETVGGSILLLFAIAALVLANSPLATVYEGFWQIPLTVGIVNHSGSLTLIAPRAPIGAKVFLTALAIVDDMGAVIVIALFYSDAIAWGALGGAAVLLLILIGFNATGVRRLWPYLFGGVVFWFFIHE